MLYTPLTKRAMRLCFDAHAGQFDKCGIAYANHPLHLAEQMTTEDETCVALLHDVMEDCGKTPDDLRAIGLSERAIEALELLTHRDDVPYLDYVRGVQGNPIARKVKVADLRHNSELARLDVVTSKDLARLRKYMEARVLLGDMAYELATPVGPVSVTVNGEPYPFEVVDETREACSFFEETDADAAREGMAPVAGSTDRTFWLEIDTLPLAVGDQIAVVYDFGSEVVDRGSGEHVSYQVHVKDDYTIGLGFYDDESYGIANSWCSYRFDPAGQAYTVVDDPVRHRYYRFAHKFGMRIAWRHGASEADALIVGWAAGF